MFKCIGLITFETFVLVVALFVYIYSRKNEVAKWLQYLTASITLFVATLIIGTVFCCCMMCMSGCDRGGRQGCNKGDMQYRSCDRDEMSCSNGNNGDMEEDCCMKGNMDNCEMGGEEREIRIEINEDELGGKDTIEKKVIIKKTK